MPLRGKASAKTYGSGVFIIMHSLETVFLSTNIYVILPWYVRMLPSASEKISQSIVYRILVLNGNWIYLPQSLATLDRLLLTAEIARQIVRSEGPIHRRSSCSIKIHAHAFV